MAGMAAMYLEIIPAYAMYFGMLPTDVLYSLDPDSELFEHQIDDNPFSVCGQGAKEISFFFLIQLLKIRN